MNLVSDSGAFCGLLIAFKNSLDPEQAQQNAGPDLDPRLFDKLMVFQIFFEKVSPE